MSFPTPSYIDWLWNPGPSVETSLASSNVGAFPPERLIKDPATLQTGPEGHHQFGYGPLRAIIADTYGVSEAEVLITLGTAGANFAALAAISAYGDRVGMEWPSYTPPIDAARSLGLEVLQIRRPRAQGFDVDLESAEATLVAGAKALFISDLHNPTAVALPEDTFQALRSMCEAHGAYLIIDEVYRDFRHPHQPRSFRAEGGPVICTSSCSKVYGLGYVRAGWMLGPPELLKAAWSVAEVSAGMMPTPNQVMTLRLFERRREVTAWSQEIVSRGQALLEKYKAVEPRLTFSEGTPASLTCAFLPDAVDPDDFFKRLAQVHGTRVVPGHHFGMPQAMRIGLGVSGDQLRRGLAKLSRTLDDLGV